MRCSRPLPSLGDFLYNAMRYRAETELAILYERNQCPVVVLSCGCSTVVPACSEQDQGMVDRCGSA